MEQLKHILKDHGLRITGARLTVLETFLRSSRIYDHNALLDACGGRVDRVTLYRTLHVFYEHKMLYKVPSSNGLIQYGLRGIHGHTVQGEPIRQNHLHLICQDCGKIISISPYSLPLISIPQGFQTHYVDLFVNGKCTSCAEK
jgi:Fur family ferric uptake transcriptional regulator